MFVPKSEQLVGAYRLIRAVGRGGMGEVWEAEDTRLMRRVAVKILAPELAADAEARSRLLREARLAAQLNHPSIATIHAIEEHEGSVCLVMEYIDGPSLGTALRARTLSDHDVVRIVRDVAEALSAAHARGIVHRDIKPDNVMVADRRVKVLDFGIAKQMDVQTPDFRTQAGVVIGTLEYMSPEQALGKALDARSDIFSLGVLLYEALAGEIPFRGATATELMLRICRDAPRPLGALRPDLSPELLRVVTRCMEKEPGGRFASAAELATALDALLPSMSRDPRGSAATVMLSMLDRPDTEPPAQTGRPLSGRRMLVADDDAAIRRLFVVLAQRQGIETDEAANGPEAIALLKNKEYELMFLDLMMPRIDGWGVLDFLRTRGRERAPKRLFVITAFLDQNVSAADAEIVRGVIYKPFDTTEIAALIREVMEGGTSLKMLEKTRCRVVA